MVIGGPVVPVHHELARGTLHDIIKQSGLTRDELIALLWVPSSSSRVLG